MPEIVSKIRYSERGLSKSLKKYEVQKNSLISDVLSDLQSWSKYYGNLEYFNRDPINHK